MGLAIRFTPTIGVAAGNLFVALALGLGVFRGLAERWWVVDVPATLLLVLLAASGAALLTRWRLRFRLLEVAAFAVLSVGLSAILALATSIAFLRSIFGAVGSGGRLLFVLSILLVLPYLVVYPVGLLIWLRRTQDAAS